MIHVVGPIVVEYIITRPIVVEYITTIEPLEVGYVRTGPIEVGYVRTGPLVVVCKNRTASSSFNNRTTNIRPEPKIEYV